MPKIKEMFAFIQIDAGPDDEGVVAWKIGGTWMPLVGADMKRVDSLRPLAKKISEITGKMVVLSRFSVREDMEIIT